MTRKDEETLDIRKQIRLQWGSSSRHGSGSHSCKLTTWPLIYFRLLVVIDILVAWPRRKYSKTKDRTESHYLATCGPFDPPDETTIERTHACPLLILWYLLGRGKSPIYWPENIPEYEGLKHTLEIFSMLWWNDLLFSDPFAEIDTWTSCLSGILIKIYWGRWETKLSHTIWELADIY